MTLTFNRTMKDKWARGRKVYGSKPGEAAVLERIIRERNAGATMHGIAAGLNRDGIPTRMGRKWMVGQIAKILARPPA